MEQTLFVMIVRIFSSATFLLVLFACSDEPVRKPNPGFVYFLVTEASIDKGDSYILPLLDPEDIAEARAIIAEGEHKIVLAKTTRNPDINYHRNVDLLRNKVWSWHVAEFIGFVDNTIEIYDGWPGYVEDNYAEWLETTRDAEGFGVIGFWDYTLEREVALEELDVSIK
jgi:hypothetical protein